MSDSPPPVAPADFSLLRRSCGPCTLRDFCAHAELHMDEARRRGLFGQRAPLYRGERLFRTGDAQTSVYIVRAGALKTVVNTADGEECVLGFHLPEELVGLDALSSGHHECEAVALVDSQVCAVPYNELARLTASVPDLHLRLLGLVGHAVQAGPAHVQMLVRRQADERVALFLLEMQQRCVGGEGPNRVVLPMSREDIARYLGLALETVSRGLSRLQELRAIRVSGRRIDVLDQGVLVQLAGVPPGLSRWPADSPMPPGRSAGRAPA